MFAFLLAVFSMMPSAHAELTYSHSSRALDGTMLFMDPYDLREGQTYAIQTVNADSVCVLFGAQSSIEVHMSHAYVVPYTAVQVAADGQLSDPFETNDVIGWIRCAPYAFSFPNTFPLPDMR